ncbi:MAG: polysaccharide deacetylase family protein [Deltaproteobacteria bacterium]|nr:polysaccharide deacetylase family protein [Deltaproteobacteria bacterium]
MAIWPFIIASLGLAGAGLAARYTFWRPNQSGVPAFMYHYITDELEGTKLKKLRVSPSTFAWQMDYLKSKGYHSIGLREYYLHLTAGQNLPARPFMITFDDGARDCLTQARDVLESRGFTAAVFVVTDLVGQTNAWDRDKNEPLVSLLNWEELKELIEAGWEVGSHTRTHMDLTTCTNKVLAEELAGSRDALGEKLGVDVLALAYPYGHVNEAVKEAALKAGYRLAWTIQAGKNEVSDDPLELKRIIIKRKDTRLDFALKLKKGKSTL